jgi:hypothetical protein
LRPHRACQKARRGRGIFKPRIFHRGHDSRGFSVTQEIYERIFVLSDMQVALSLLLLTSATPNSLMSLAAVRCAKILIYARPGVRSTAWAYVSKCSRVGRSSCSSIFPKPAVRSAADWRRRLAVLLPGWFWQQSRAARKFSPARAIVSQLFRFLAISSSCLKGLFCTIEPWRALVW